MGVDLLKHNQEAFQEINKMIDSGIKKIADSVKIFSQI